MDFIQNPKFHIFIRFISIMLGTALNMRRISSSLNDKNDNKLYYLSIIVGLFLGYMWFKSEKS